MTSTFVSLHASGTTLLLVGADPRMGERFGRILAQIGENRFHLDQACSCKDALSRFRENDYDVCLVNVAPGELPATLSELVGPSNACRGTPVIVMAENRQAGLRAIEAGAADYLEWSNLSPDLLERSIRYVLQKRELAQQAARLDSERSAMITVQKRNFRLKLLSETASELLTVHDPVELLHRLYPALSAHLKLDCCLHYLVEEIPEVLTLNSHIGVPDALLEQVRQVEFDAVLSIDARGDADASKKAAGRAGFVPHTLGLRAYFCYPLMVHGFILGALSFGSQRRSRFSPSEVVFLRAICHYVATALERKRLSLELTDRANRLAESEQRFRVMAETVPDFLLSGRAEGSCDFCNRQFSDYTGLTLEQATGSGWLDAMHPEDAERVRQNWARVCDKDEVFEIEHRFRTKEGVYRWFVGRWHGLCNEKGEVERWIGSCADIDELKRVEGALRDNQTRLHQAVAEAERRAAEAEEGRRVLEAIMEHVPIGIAVADRPETVRFVSRYGRDMLTRPESDKSSKTNGIPATLGQILSMRDNSLLARAITEGETVKNQEVAIRNQAGVQVPLLCSSGPIRDGAGRITGAVVTWVDITERKRSERVLKQSERQFRAIFETSPDCIVIVDDEIRLAKVNAAATAAFGVDPEHLIGRCMAEFVRPPERIEEIRRDLLQTGRYSGELQIERPDGRVADFDVGAAFSIIPGRHLMVFHNTTERRSMERQLRDSETRFRTLAQALPQIVWTAQPDGQADFYNDQLTETTGLSVEQACSIGWGELLPPEDLEATAAAWKHAVETGGIFDVEHRLRQKDGTYRWFLSRSVPIRDETGRIVKWFGSTTNIDDQKKAEQTLALEHAAVENERRRLRAVLDVLPVAVFIADKQGRVTDVNPAVATTWDRLPVLSQNPDEFASYYLGYSTKTGKPVSARERGLYRALAQGETIAAEEMEFQRADNRRGTILNYAVPIRDGSGAIMGAAAVSVDITDLKRTQRQLIELNDALEQRVRDRTRSLLTYQEHLRAMASELVLTEQRERRRLATELHDYLAQLLVASKMKSKLVSYHVQESGTTVMEELRGLIDEALKYTRTLIADLSPTILYEAGLYAAIHWLGEQMARHRLTIHIDQQGEPVDMPVDQAVMIFQTVRELLFNVVKHAKVSEATVRLEQTEAGELEVTVADCGAGFDPSLQELEPAGGKFGLFSVRERLGALGGVFEIHSAPGQGTRAVVRVPLEQLPIQVEESSPEVRTTTTSVGQPSRRDTIRVLLVDDHKMVREGFRTLIECDARLEVAGEAANGEDAIELTRILQPDIVIMDINMPKMNGIEATRRIKQEMPHISIIGLSVHDDRGLIASMLEAGASTYLTKGGQSEELSRAIHETFAAQTQGHAE